MKLLQKFKGNSLKEKFSVGLDIGCHSIKIIKLDVSSEVLELDDFKLIPLPADGLAPVLKGLKESSGISAANISVSGIQSITRYVHFPKMTAEELKRSLKFEAQKHLPFSLDEIYLDGCILRDDLPDNKMLVLLTAVKKEFIHKRLKIFEEAGLKVNTVDIDSIALINAFNFNYSQDEGLKNKAIALLNIGASISNLDILESGLSYLSRDIQIAGNNLTQRIADSLGMDFKSAEEAKLSPSPEQRERVSVALESVLTNLAQEIRTSFDYFESQSTSSVSKIFLSGGTSRCPGIKEMFANLLGIEVEDWDPLKTIRPSQRLGVENGPKEPTQLAVAVGLALRK